MKFTRRKKLPVVLEPGEAQKLIKQPNKRYPTGIRNKAIILVMLNTGLRVSEITDLKPGSINLTSVLSITICRIKPFQLYPGIISCKLPIHLSTFVVSILLPGQGLSFYNSNIINSSI